MKRVFYSIQSFINYMNEKFQDWEIWPMQICSDSYPEGMTFNERDLLKPAIQDGTYELMDIEFRFEPFEPDYQLTFTEDVEGSTLEFLRQWNDTIRNAKA